MKMTEKVAYIRGLAEGLELDENKKEVKVLNAMLELLDDMAATVSELEEGYQDMADQLDEVDADLGDLEAAAMAMTMSAAAAVKTTMTKMTLQMTMSITRSLAPAVRKPFACLRTLSPKEKLIARTAASRWNLIWMEFMTRSLNAAVAAAASNPPN